MPSSGFQERFVRSFLDWVMLAILDRKPSYGYEMITIIGDEYGVFVSPGSLYPILYDLDEQGLITGTWDNPDKRTRKVYTLTPEGIEFVHRGFERIEGILASLRRRR